MQGDAPAQHLVGTAESCIFPYHFRDGYGFYNGLGTTADYCERRIRAQFSPFTLDPAYVLGTAQKERSKQVLASLRQGALNKDLEYRRSKHPNESMAETIRYVAKHTMKETVMGSPVLSLNEILLG